MNIVVDAGALLAIDRGDRQVRALLRSAELNEVIIRTSAAAVAQVWRNGSKQAHLARMLKGMFTAELNLEVGKCLGMFLGISGSRDVVQHINSNREILRAVFGHRTRRG